MTQPLHQDYDLLEELGRGRFGIVRRCRHRTTATHFAVKSIDKSLSSADPLDRLSLSNEPKALHHLSHHPHITTLRALYDEHNHLHLILDLFPFPYLLSLLPLPDARARPIFTALLRALRHCQLHGVAHRDVKPDNILVDPHNLYNVKLCDFGAAEFFKEGESLVGLVGTPYYVAPEVVQGRRYSEKCDLWSAGVVLYVMLSGLPPFYGETVEEIFEGVVRGNVRFPARVFGNVSPAVKDLIRRLLC